MVVSDSGYGNVGRSLAFEQFVDSHSDISCDLTQ